MGIINKLLIGVALCCIGVLASAQEEDVQATDTVEAVLESADVEVLDEADSAVDAVIRAVEDAEVEIEEAAEELEMEDAVEGTTTRSLGTPFTREEITINDEDTLHLYDSSFAGLELLDDTLSQFKVFITGENHTYTESNARLWLKMIKYLHANAGVRNIMFEYGYTYGYLVNEYLQTGDTTLFSSIDQFAYKEYSAVIKELREFNEELPDSAKLYFAAIDIDRGIYPVAKMLAHMLPADSVPVPDSIYLHVASLKSLMEYNDFKLDEQDDETSSYLRGRGFTFKTGATLDLVQNNFLKYKELYQEYLGDGYAAFENIIINKFNDRKQWEEYESAGAIQEYIYRENYMHQNFLKEQAAHPGNWFGQFGRCHTTKAEQTSNSCEWFKFNSLADRIKNTKGGEFKDAVMTIAIVYDSDRNFGPDRSGEYALFNPYFEDMPVNRIALVDLSKDTALNKSFGTDFDYLFVNSFTQYGSSYEYLNDWESESDIRIKILGGYTQTLLNLNDLSQRFINESSSQGFDNLRTSWEFTFMAQDERTSTGFTFGSYLNEKQSVDTTDYTLSGYYVKNFVYIDLLKNAKWLDVMPGVGVAYNKLKMKSEETTSVPNLSNGFFGETKTSFSTNDAFVFDLGFIIDLNIKKLTIGYQSGYILDVSKKHWKSNGKIDETTPETSFTGTYNTVRVGFNF
jgi:hypothetical protein